MHKARLSGALSLVLLVTASGTAAVGTDAAMASRAATTHTIKFTAHTLRSHNFKNSGIQTERDTRHGKTVGFGLLNCVFPQGENPKCSNQYALNGGTVFVQVTLNPPGPDSGKVTGGTRQFRGATGTMTASPGPTDSTTKIVINYHN